MIPLKDNLYIDIHRLITIPPSCANRDDTGALKTSEFGGFTRNRISSQSYRKNARDIFQANIDDSHRSNRTKHSIQLVADAIQANDQSVSRDDAIKDARAIIEMAINPSSKSPIKYDDTEKLAHKNTLYIGKAAIKALAKLTLRKDITKQKRADAAKAILDGSDTSVAYAYDISMFGRMVASNSCLNTEGAVQTSHSVSVGLAHIEHDYFTQMDDYDNGSQGANYIDTTEFSSWTDYWYNSINVLQLCKNLKDDKEATLDALGTVIDAIIKAMPQGKHNTFAINTLPSLLLVQIRDTQPVSLVNAFESPVRPTMDKTMTELACERLITQTALMDEAFETKPLMTYAIIGSPDTAKIAEIADETGPISKVIGSICDYVGEYLDQRLPEEA